MTKIRMDFVPCLLIGAALFAMMTFAGKKYVEIANERYETQELPEGEIGGEPSEDTPLVSNIAEMKENDTFYALTEDTQFFMYYLFYDDKDWKAIELPSGEVICARVNYDACHDVDSYRYVQLPVGKIVPFDMPDTLVSQLADERKDMEFTDTSFYVDMYGARLDSPDEDEIEFRCNMIGLILFWVGTFGSHMIGAKIGILPPIFPKRKKEQA